MHYPPTEKYPVHVVCGTRVTRQTKHDPEQTMASVDLVVRCMLTPKNEALVLEGSVASVTYNFDPDRNVSRCDDDFDKMERQEDGLVIS